MPPICKKFGPRKFVCVVLAILKSCAQTVKCEGEKVTRKKYEVKSLKKLQESEKMSNNQGSENEE